MADTERSLADLLVLLANNTTGDISEQDHRDVVVSLAPPFGGMHLSTPIETSISAQNTPAKILGTTTIAGTNRDFDMPDSNKLRYTGAPTRYFHLDASLSVISAASNKVFAFFIYKGGVQEAASEIVRKQGTAADIGALSLTYHIELATNEFIEIYVENLTDGTNMTVNQMVVNMTGMIE